MDSKKETKSHRSKWFPCGFESSLQAIVSGRTDKPTKIKVLPSSYYKIFKSSSYRHTFSGPKHKLSQKELESSSGWRIAKPSREMENKAY